MSMAKFPYKWAAVPQRYVKGLGFVECNPHRADVWTAFAGNRIIGRYGNKAMALEAIRITKVRKEGPTRKYKLGGMLEPRLPTVGTVAESLTTAQFNALNKEHDQ